MLYTFVIYRVYSLASPELGWYKFGVSRLGGASNTFQVTPNYCLSSISIYVKTLYQNYLDGD